MKGRKPLYRPESLKLGEKMQLKGKAKKFAHQYVRQFNSRVNGNGEQFKYVSIDNKPFIERIA